jgi:hypothetical protein
MESLLPLLLLWAGFLLVLWWVRNGLDGVEASLLEARSHQPAIGATSACQGRFDKPDMVAEVIGQYMDTPIYRRIVKAGVDYEFDHIDPPGGSISRRPNERYLTPGIVYARTD